MWKNQECVLTIHNELGFILSERNGGSGHVGQHGGQGGGQTEIWTQPFHNLCASNDDGAKLLWLQFRGIFDFFFSLGFEKLFNFFF